MSLRQNTVRLSKLPAGNLPRQTHVERDPVSARGTGNARAAFGAKATVIEPALDPRYERRRFAVAVSLWFANNVTHRVSVQLSVLSPASEAGVSPSNPV